MPELNNPSVGFDTPSGTRRFSGHAPGHAARLIFTLGLCAALSGCGQGGESQVFEHQARTLKGGYVMPVRALRYTPDGRHLLAGDNEGRLFRFDLAVGQPEVIWTGHNAPITSLALRKDGRVASFGLDGAFRIIEPTPDGPPPLHGVIPPSAPSAAVISPDGAHALAWIGPQPPGQAPTLCGPRPAPLVLTRSEGQTLRPLADGAVCAAFDAVGKHLVFVAAATLTVQSVLSGDVVAQFPLQNAADVRGVAVSSDGKRVAAIVRGELMLFDAGAEAPDLVLGRQELSERALPVVFTPDGTSVVALLPDAVEAGRYNLDRYDARSGEAQARLFASVPETLVALDLAPDGEVLAFAERGGPIHRVRLSDGQQVGKLLPHHWLGGGVSLSQDGQHIATCWQSSVEVRQVADGQRLSQFTVPGLPCSVDYPLALSPDGKRLLLGAAERQPFVARDLQGQVVATYNRPPGASVRRPTWSRNGAWVVARVHQGTGDRLFFWPASGGAPVGDALIPPVGALRGLVVTDDGQRAVASFGHVQQDGRIVGELAGFSPQTSGGPIWARGDPQFWLLGALALGASDARVFYTSESDEVLVLDTTTGADVAQLSNSADTAWTFARFSTVGALSVLPTLEQPVPRQPLYYANAIAVDPQGGRVAVAGYNRSNRVPLLEVFDLATGKLVAVTRILNYPRALKFVGGRLLAPGVRGPGGDMSVFDLRVPGGSP